MFFNANPYRILKGGLSARGIEVLFKEFSKKLETPMTARSLRQACIFKWMAKDIPQARIKEWMGVRPSYDLKEYIKLREENLDKFQFPELRL